MNVIDLQSTQLLLCSEKKCHKLRTDMVEFSPFLSKLGLRQRFQRKVIHYKQSRFFNLNYVLATASYLKIAEHIYLPIQLCIEKLQVAKEEYLHHKSSQQSLRDSYIAQLENEEALVKRNSKKLKQHWRILNRYFGKSKAKAILEVEYSIDKSVVRVSSQIRVEQAIIAENS